MEPKRMWILLFGVMLMGSRYSSAGIPETHPVKIEDQLESPLIVGSGEVDAPGTLNLFEPDKLDESDRNSLWHGNLGEVSDQGAFVSQSADGGSKSSLQQQEEPTGNQELEPEWKEPFNEMTLVRFFNGRYYQRQYSEINKYLIRETDDRGWEANMGLVAAMLKREKQKGVNPLNRALVEALEQLVALSETHGPNKCGRDSYAIIWKNNKATSGRAHVAPSRFGPARRIDALVHQMSLLHAIDCFPVYPSKFQELRSSLDSSTRRVVERFTNSVMGDSKCTRSSVKLLKGRRVAELAYSLISEEAANDPARAYLGKVVDERVGKFVVDGKRVELLVKQYLVEPCRVFTRTLGPDLFIPTRFDAEMIEKEDRYAGADQEEIEFLHGWLQYRLCDFLIKREEPELTKRLVSYIEKKYK